MGGAAATAVAALPIVHLARRATEDGLARMTEILWRPGTLALTATTLRLAVVVTLASLVIGVGLAWLLTCTDLPGRRGLRVVATLPLAVPSYVAAYAWLGWRPTLAGFAGSALVLTSVSYPFVLLPVAAALRGRDPALDDVARTLGLTPQRTFWQVTLPQVRPAVVGGALLVGLYVMSDFGAVAIMRTDTLTRAIATSYRASFDRTPAAVLGLLLAVLAIAVVAIEHRVRPQRGPLARSGAGARRPAPVVSLGRWRWPAVAAAAVVPMAALGIPAVGLQRWWTQGRTENAAEGLLPAAVNSLSVGILGAVLVIALALPVAILTVRHPGRLASAATGAAYAGHALPGVAVGLSLVFFGIQVVPGLYQRLPLLLVGYAVLYLSLALGGLEAALRQIPPGLDGVARTLGRGPLGAWRAVTARLAAPGVAAAATLVLLAIAKELPTTLFLRPIGFDTLATEMWTDLSSLRRAGAVPEAVAIVLLAAVPAAILGAVGERRGER